MTRLDLKAGDHNNRLTLLECVGPNKHGRIMWRAVCDCSPDRFVILEGSEFKSGHTKSCGCLKIDILRANRVIHGQSNSAEHRIWSNMKSRCYNQKTPSYKDYGARGITVCERWRNSFADFLADMGTRPSNDHTLERKDNDEQYNPENCVWETRLKQAQNTRKNVWVVYEGEDMVVAEAARRAGVSAFSVYGRTHRYGETHQEAFDHFVELKARNAPHA